MFAANYNMEANVACDDCCELPACVGSGMDMDETVAGLVYGASQGQVTVNGCYDGLPTLLGLLGVTCDTDMSLFTDQLPAGTTAQMLCGCSCPDPVVTTCMDDTACNYEAVGECTYADEGFDCAGDPLVCDGSGTNDNASVAAQFYGFGCEGAIATMMGSYGYTEDEACAFDGMVPNIDETTGEFLGMIMMFDLGGQTLGDFCGCSCADPVPAGMLVTWASTDSWPEENGFSITDCDGNVLASMEAGAGFSAYVELPDNYILTMTDSYGDGGGQVTIGDTVYTLDGGSSESFVVGVCAISGCTDAAACNYDSTANEDDGSCTFAAEGFDCDGNQLDCTGDVTANLSWVGDGYCDDGAFGQYLDCETFNYDDGDCGHWSDPLASNYGVIAECEYAPTGTQVTWASTDSWPTENGFSITDCDGNVLASMEAGAGFDEAVVLPDNYILTLTDSYGDGGGQVTIGDTVYTLDGGSSESFVVGVCAISGCTDAAACNYDSTANEDDGSCTFAAEGFDCDGNQLDCTGDVTANLSWVGDGYCDDGAFGQYLDCETFNYDDGDCGHCVDPLASNYGVIAECEYAPTGTQVTWASTDSWPTENGFSITDCDGNVLASMEAGAGFDEAVVLPDNYILTLTDSYGDGGGQVTIGDTVYTLDGGSSDCQV